MIAAIVDDRDPCAGAVVAVGHARDGKLMPVEVETGVSANGQIEIRAGLTDTDAIALPLAGEM